MLRRLVLLACFVITIGVGSPIVTAQNQSVPVAGVEVVAAVNLTPKNIRAQGTIFIPDATRVIRAVIVIVERCPACTVFGVQLYGDRTWRELAQTCGCALLDFTLGFIRPIDPSTAQTADDVLRSAAVGGGDALEMLLRQLGQASRHPELQNTPVLFWGWSAAASFGASFAEFHPDRTVAFVRYHTHLRGMSHDMRIIGAIPALLIAGAKDQRAGTEDAATFWKQARAAGAPWTFAIEPNAAHGSEDIPKTIEQLVTPWMKAVLSARLVPGASRLRAISVGDGWLGDIVSRQFGPAASVVGSKAEASWLPDEATARGWRAVVNGTQ